uniref:Uncharacterized protein n=1 Tax=Lates calcarifer TaxID=8187 RepID=A0A4W6DV73_LATCA
PPPIGLECGSGLDFMLSKTSAASCPFVEGLNLQEADSMLQLLCTPSHHRTDILAWICTDFLHHTKITSYTTVALCLLEMAVLGQELMLCNAGDLDLIRVRGKLVWM